ncbi:MAG: ferritin [Bacteroidaceae bacterium]|nr:ferritin [Bacteroidaceae bacterium]
MITKKIEGLLNKQVNAELWSAYLYLSMSLDADCKGLPGMTNWFFVQAREEFDHSRILQRYITAQDGKVMLEPIAAVPTAWDSPLCMFEDALKHEQRVTSMIHELTHEAMRQQDYATISHMQWFIDEQVEEEEVARDIILQMRPCVVTDKDCVPMLNFSSLFLIDRKLGKRKYQQASPLADN